MKASIFEVTVCLKRMKVPHRMGDPWNKETSRLERQQKQECSVRNFQERLQEEIHLAGRYVRETRMRDQGLGCGQRWGEEPERRETEPVEEWQGNVG